MPKLVLLMLCLPIMVFSESLKLAVFKVDSKLLGTEQSALLSEMLTAECSKSGQYEVVPWSEVGNALKMASDKSKLGEISSKGENMECTNSKCYDALGTLDVRFMVTARVEKPGRQLFMTLKLTDVELMKQVKVISTKAVDVDALFDDLPNLVPQLLGQISTQENKDSINRAALQVRQDSIRAEQSRQAELKRQAEEARLAALEKARQDSIQTEQVRQAEALAKQKAEENKRQTLLEEQRKVELARTAEAKQKQEALELKRQEEQMKQADATRQAVVSSAKAKQLVLVSSLRWGGLGLAGVGALYALQQNNAATKAKASYDASKTQAEYDANWSGFTKAKTGTSLGLGLLGLGLASFGFSYAF